MSDFPKCGDIEATRAWLDKEGFEGLFVGWKADAILGLEERHVLAQGGDKALMLWGLLNTARMAGGTLFISFIPLFLILENKSPDDNLLINVNSSVSSDR